MVSAWSRDRKLVRCRTKPLSNLLSHLRTPPTSYDNYGCRCDVRAPWGSPSQ